MLLIDVFTRRLWRLPHRWMVALLLGPWALLAAHAEDLRIGGTGSALGTLQTLAAQFMRHQPAARIIVLPSMGSGGGIKAVLSGAIQLGVSSRPLTDAERQAGAVAVEYGRTPVVLAAHRSNLIDGLGVAALADILAGRTQDWPDGTRIRLVMRPQGESDIELIKAIDPALRQAMDQAEQRQGLAMAVTDQDTATLIEKVPGALGVSTLALILSERRGMRALAWNRVAPSVATLSDGSYPLAKTLWVVTGSTPTALAREFIDFLRSPAGREQLARTGHWVK